MTIQGFMRTELNLKGNELMVYALIYGFSLTDEGWFTGSRQYLADWLGCTTRTVQSVLDKMVSDGLLIKRKSKQNGASSYCDYRVKKVKNFPKQSEKISLKKVKNFPKQSEKISHHNNIYKYKYINIENTDISPEEITEGLFDYD